MNPTPILSICIPTHNRAPYLRVSLESIASQIQPDVEIVISDDACTDDTADVVESFRKRLPHLTYDHREPALRYDRNVLHVVEMAGGDFCWLFGDDDRMEPGGLERVLQVLRKDRELTGLTVDRVNYDHDLAREITVRPSHQNQTIIFADAEECFLKLLDRLGFLSCQIVNRQRWIDIAQSENLEPYFLNYVQLYVIARMMVARPRWMFLGEKCVGFRSDNDSFRRLGSVGRLQMDVCGYEKIVGDIFGRDSDVFRKAMSEVATTHARHHIIGAKRARAPFSFTLQSIFLCVRHYWRYPRFWLKTFPVLLLPRAILLALRKRYQSARAS